MKWSLVTSLDANRVPRLTPSAWAERKCLYHQAKPSVNWAGSTAEAPYGYWTLVNSESTAGVEQKKKLALAYGAHAVDMESAAVARAAQCRGIPFLALKVISDAHDFEMPPVDRFVSHDGRFRTGRFLLFALLRPWWWLRVVRLARNSNKAIKALCRWLDQYNHEVQLSELGPGLHLTTVSH